MTKKLLKKKTPSDYPQMAIRLTQEEKEAINEILAKIIRYEKKRRGSDCISPKKNEFIIQGLNIGLKKIMNEIMND
jgi:hypothetical protein